jgi:hypothetical protein
LIEFHLPYALVQLAGSENWQGGVVGKERQASAIRVRVANASKSFGISLLGVENDKLDQLLAHRSGASIHGSGIEAAELEVGFGSCNKEAARLMYPVELLEVEIASIHHVEGA